MQVWSKKWKQVLIWFSAYFSFTAFALVGGYAILKENDDMKKTAKQAFIVTLIFAALSAFLSIFYDFRSLSDNPSASSYDFYSTATALVAIAKIVVYAVFLILAFVKKDAPATNQEAKKPDYKQSF